MNLFIYILKCFLLVSSSAPTSSFLLLRRQGGLSARGIGMGPDICGECVYQHQNPLKWKDWIGFCVTRDSTLWQANPTGRLAGNSGSNCKQRRQRQFEFFGLIINAWCFGDFICIFLRSGTRRTRRTRTARRTTWRGRRRWTTATTRLGTLCKHCAPTKIYVQYLPNFKASPQCAAKTETFMEMQKETERETKPESNS